MLGNTVSASGLFEHPLNDYKGVVTGAAIVRLRRQRIRSADSTAAAA